MCCLKATEPQQGDSLRFTTNCPEIPGTHLSTLERWKAELTLDLPIGFEFGIPGLRIHCIATRPLLHKHQTTSVNYYCLPLNTSLKRKPLLNNLSINKCLSLIHIINATLVIFEFSYKRKSSFYVLLGCPTANFETMLRGHLNNLMFMTAFDTCTTRTLPEAS